MSNSVSANLSNSFFVFFAIPCAWSNNPDVGFIALKILPKKVWIPPLFKNSVEVSNIDLSPDITDFMLPCNSCPIASLKSSKASPKLFIEPFKVFAIAIEAPLTPSISPKPTI